MRQKGSFKWLAVTALFLLVACSDRLHTGDIPSEDVLSDSNLSSQADALVWKRVAVSTDDAEEAVNTGSITLNSIDLDFGSNASGSTAVGVRFTGISVPKGAQIQSAYLYFLPKEATSGTTTLQIAAQASDNAGTFTSTARNVTSRTRTANISWSVPAWSAPTTLNDPAVRSPNLASVVQTVVNRSGWLENNALAFIIQGSGERIAHSFDGEPGNKPALEISYTIPVVSTSCLTNSSPVLDWTNQTFTESKYLENQTSKTGVNAEGSKFLGKQPLRITDNPDTDLPEQPTSTDGYICLSGGYFASKLAKGDNAVWDCKYILNTTDREACYLDGSFHGTHAIMVGVENSKPARQGPSTYTTIENVTVGTTGDAFAFKHYTKGWTVRNAYVRHSGDDAIESDFFNNGVVDNVLVDWSYTGFSCRIGSTAEPANATFTIKNSLLALRPQHGIYEESNADATLKPGPSHARLFKWNRDSGDYIAKHGCKLVLQDNVFLMRNSAGHINPEEDTGVSRTELWDSFDPSLCRNNLIIYLGDNSSYKNQLDSEAARLPTGCFDVRYKTATVTKDDLISLWRQERSAWFDRNPQFKAYRTEEPIAPGF